MSFISLPFLLLLAIVLPLYYLLPQRARWVLLLLASGVFYAWFDARLLLLILLTVAVSYAAALGISRTERRGTKKLLLALALTVCFGSLVFFKYAAFLVDSAISLCNLLGGSIEPVVLQIILPVGISFYTFQTVSYVIDVYRGTVAAERHFGYYALFVSFFPQLVAGPIEKAADLLPQFKEKHAPEIENFKRGAALMAAGFFKKVAIADVLSVLVDAVYNSPDLKSVGAAAILLATVLFFFQIYCDFSGYSDIAVGCAALLGIDLMSNFRKPFSAQNITEFWQRWHISLTNWFNEYIYMPLAYRTIGKKHMALRNCLHLLLVMLLCGFWHGANWTYVIWGLWIGVYQCIEILTRRRVARWYERRGKDPDAPFRRLLRKVRTFVLLLFPLIFFRANSVGDAFILLGNVFTGWSAPHFAAFLPQTGLTLSYALMAVLLIVCLKFLDDAFSVPRGENSFGERSASVWFAEIVLIVWAVGAAYAHLALIGHETPFIYFQF